MVVGLTTTDAISAYHHNVVNSNPADDEVYSMQHYVIMLFSELRKVDGFRWALRFPIPLSMYPSIISIKEGRIGGSLLISPTPLLLFSTEKKRRGVGERRRLPPVLPSFIYIIDGQIDRGIGNGVPIEHHRPSSTP